MPSTGIENNLSLVSKVAVATIKTEETRAELIDKALLGEAMAKKLCCRDNSLIAFAISEVERDIDGVLPEPSFSSFSNMLSIIAILVAVTALPSAFEPFLKNEPFSLVIYVALAIALSVFSLLLFGQSVYQFVQRTRRIKTLEELEEARNALTAFMLTGGSKYIGNRVGKVGTNETN